MESFKIKDVFQLFILKHLIYGDHDKIPGKPESALQTLEAWGANYVLMPSPALLILTCILCEGEPRP